MSAPAPRKDVTHDQSRPFLQRRGSHLAVIAIVLVALIGTVAVRSGFFRQPDLQGGLSAFLEAYRFERPLEARISELRYAPVAHTRGLSGEGFDHSSLDRAERLLLVAVSDEPGPASHHALGRLYLAKQSYQFAIAEIEEALREEPNSAQHQSDYGAALLEIGKDEQSRGEFGKGLASLGRSLEHLDLALTLNQSSLEAAFNRALCLQSMEMPHQAAAAWQSYLDKDGDSSWAEEARQNLDALSGRSRNRPPNRDEILESFTKAYDSGDDGQAWKTLCASRDAAGGLLENKLIDDYLEHAIAGNEVLAKNALDVLSKISALEYRRSGDRFIPDLVRTYEIATRSQRKSMVRARTLLMEGRRNYSKSNYGAALEAYVAARGVFEASGDPCEAARATFLIGDCYVQLSRPQVGIGLLEPLSDACETSGYKRLLAQTLSGLSNANQYLRDFSTAINNTNRSLSLWVEIGDTRAALRTQFLLADIYRFLHDYGKALDMHAFDLSLVREYAPQPEDSYRHYASISLTLDQLDLHSAAIAFQREALRQAVEAKDQRLISRSYSFLGSIQAGQGDYAQAEDNTQHAIEAGGLLQERRVRLETIGYSLLKMGLVHRMAGNREKAVEDYNRSLQSYAKLTSHFFEYTARKERLLCCLDPSPGCPPVEQELPAVLNLYEQHRSKILEEGIRNTFFDSEQTIYDLAIEFEYTKGEQKKAFEYSEKSRGRSLRDMIGNEASVVGSPDNPDVRATGLAQPITIDKIRARMPKENQILQYSVLPNRIISWVVSRDGLATESRSISIKELNQRVRRFLQLVSSPMESDHEEFSREAVGLYELLIKPVEGLLDSRKQLCIVPDKILNHLPFAALISESSRKYFIETRRFVLSPSSTIFVLCSDAAREKESTRCERLLSVGNPLFDKKKFAGLADLRSAAREAEQVAACYDASPMPLIGGAATRRRVMAEMQNSDVIHIATHAIVNSWYPLRSKLLLATETLAAQGKDSDGVLEPYQIYPFNLNPTKLVVLSACQTGVEKYYGGEGMIGLSRPFIAKGIPLVVASLWPVDSDSTARLMISFQRIRKTEGLPTAEALRKAQIEMLETTSGNERLPYNWASFAVIGGYANF